MDELTRTGTDEGGPQHGTGLPVDGQLGLTVGVTVQKGSSGGRGVADLSSDDVLAGVAGPLFGQAAGGELGGGEDNLWDRDVLGYWFGLAAGSEGGDPLPYDARARYLPMWVSWASPLASLTA